MIGDGDILFDRRTLGHGQSDLLAHVSIIHADDRLDRGAGVTINNVVLGEHVGGRDDDGTNLTKGQHNNPPFVAAFQYQHHGIALADAQ